MGRGPFDFGSLITGICEGGGVDRSELNSEDVQRIEFMFYLKRGRSEVMVSNNDGAAKMSIDNPLIVNSPDS